MISIVVLRSGKMRLVLGDSSVVELSLKQNEVLGDWVRDHRTPPFPSQIKLTGEEGEDLMVQLSRVPD